MLDLLEIVLELKAGWRLRDPSRARPPRPAHRSTATPRSRFSSGGNREQRGQSRRRWVEITPEKYLLEFKESSDNIDGKGEFDSSVFNSTVYQHNFSPIIIIITFKEAWPDGV